MWICSPLRTIQIVPFRTLHEGDLVLRRREAASKDDFL